MYNSSSSPTLIYCTFKWNSARNGGGIFNQDSSPILINCLFSGNSAYYNGGAICNETCKNVVMTNCTFRENTADFGGAISNKTCTDIFMTGCKINVNRARECGAMNNWFSSLILNNCILSGNYAWINATGLLYIANNMTVTNCTFTGNESDMQIVGDFDAPKNFPQGYIEIANCIVWDNDARIWDDVNSTITVCNSNIQGGWEGVGNINEDPLFANPGYWADVNNTDIVVEPNNPNAVWIEGDYHLKSQGGRFDPNSGSWVIDDVTSPVHRRR
jgi:predicted outer membrane repeat protein